MSWQLDPPSGSACSAGSACYSSTPLPHWCFSLPLSCQQHPSAHTGPPTSGGGELSVKNEPIPAKYCLSNNCHLGAGKTVQWLSSLAALSSVRFTHTGQFKITCNSNPKKNPTPSMCTRIKSNKITPSIPGRRGRRISEFHATMVYRTSSKPDRTTKRTHLRNKKHTEPWPNHRKMKTKYLVFERADHFHILLNLLP